MSLKEIQEQIHSYKNAEYARVWAEGAADTLAYAKALTLGIRIPLINPYSGADYAAGAPETAPAAREEAL